MRWKPEAVSLGTKIKQEPEGKKSWGKCMIPVMPRWGSDPSDFPIFVFTTCSLSKVRDLSTFLSVMIEFCWIIIFQVSECDCCSLQRCWKEDFLTPEQHQALDWVLSYVDQGEIVLCWMLISADIYQRNYEDMEICHNSEKNLLRGSRRN